MRHAPTDRPGITWPAQAHLVPREVFESADVYERELERIFHGPLWHPLAHDAEIPRPHDYKTCLLGRIPLLISRGPDGVVRARINACTHRGVLIATRPRGNAPIHECPYHGWSYDSTGALVACPGEADFHPEFQREANGLPPARLESIDGLHFVTLDDAPSLDAYIDGTQETIRRILGGDGRLRLLGYQKVRFGVNWKAYFDQDGWHAPMLHAAFRMLNLRSKRGVLHGTETGHRAVNYEMEPVTRTSLLKDPSVIHYRHRPEDGGQLALLFPITNLNKQMDVMTIRYAQPLGPDATEVHYAYFAHADDDVATWRHRVRQSSNLLGPSGFINLEDGAVFNRIQKATPGGGLNQMVKGVKPGADAYRDCVQNDELQSLVFWNAYRRIMDFATARPQHGAPPI